ncbi:hypothetical protein TRFO_30726 [Tritrichomonas foetus]|uniref:G domain-containing protein n=1 Tax=Tritrichomonas foetus TaxID=1144522 RepID=A0A1J4JT17_9EUKA|nr:hypothetical protein TRFO_30726 [Tritrichomonas foetus]|eukprot:OHT02219.1 hypothetical protein TRFO_30726 [Tritrichomonas foetus]
MCEEVFSVVNFKEDGKGELSEPFISKIKASPNPFIITFIGETRSGKSSRLNYILEGKIKLTKPFKTSGGFEACTEGISGYGPISFCDLDPIFSLFTDSRIIHLNNYLEDNNNENIQEQIKEKIKDRNIFLIDCEGAGSIDKTTKGLNNALALLVQISSVITLVSKNPSDSLC